MLLMRYLPLMVGLISCLLAKGHAAPADVNSTGTWTSWSGWSDCSTTCGDGEKIRNRECNNTAHDELECEGRSNETMVCSIRQCPGTCQEFHTTDEYKYTFLGPRVPRDAYQFAFSVRANNDAHVALSSHPYDDGPGMPGDFIEIVIGGWNNAVSEIRKCKQCPGDARAERPNILSPTEDRHFLISYQDNSVTVSVLGEDPLMAVQYDNLNINYIGISSGWGSSGNWTICNYVPAPVFLGCFQDAGARAVPNHLMEDPAHMTVDKCVAYCRSFGDQKYAAVQYHYQCFCGNAMTNYSVYGQTNQNDCNAPCRGDDKQFCGGSWRNSVFDLVNSTWTSWSGWSDCSTTCGDGEKLRSRECNNTAHDGLECEGRSNETMACSIGPCPVHGGWSQWSSWIAECSGATVCNETGSQLRRRSCTNPRRNHNGKHCRGQPYGSRECINTDACLVNGGWGEWSNFGECSATCGPSSRKRYRECDNPTPQNGGKPCQGTGPSGGALAEVCTGLPSCPTTMNGCDDEDAECEISGDGGNDTGSIDYSMYDDVTKEMPEEVEEPVDQDQSQDANILDYSSSLDQNTTEPTEYEYSIL